jgi:hypothetical protein
MKTFSMAGAALMMLIPGVLYLLVPQFMLATPHIQLTSVNEFHAFRSAYGGGFLGIAVLFGAGVLFRKFEQTSLLAIVLILSGFALGRIYSMAVDGIPSPLFIAVLAAEIFFAVCAVMASRR